MLWKPNEEYRDVINSRFHTKGSIKAGIYLTFAASIHHVTCVNTLLSLLFALPVRSLIALKDLAKIFNPSLCVTPTTKTWRCITAPVKWSCMQCKRILGLLMEMSTARHNLSPLGMKKYGTSVDDGFIIQRLVQERNEVKSVCPSSCFVFIASLGVYYTLSTTLSFCSMISERNLDVLIFFWIEKLKSRFNDFFIITISRNEADASKSTTKEICSFPIRFFKKRNFQFRWKAFRKALKIRIKAHENVCWFADKYFTPIMSNILLTKLKINTINTDQ